MAARRLRCCARPSPIGLGGRPARSDSRLIGGVPGSDGCESCAEIEIEESAFDVVATLRVGEEFGECNDLGQGLSRHHTGEVVDVVSASHELSPLAHRWPEVEVAGACWSWRRSRRV